MLTWRAVDAKTGVTVEELPGAHCRSDIVQVIGRGEGVTIEAPWPDRMPQDWQVATTLARMVLICEDEQRIWWGGLIVGRSYGSGPHLTLTAAAPEQLLARAFMPDVTYTQKPQTELMAELGLDWLADALHGRIEIGASNRARDRTYVDVDDKARLDAMQDLMKVIDGPEFTTRWETRSDGSVGIVGLSADRLGFRATPDDPARHELYPDEWTLTESFEAGKGAVKVRASTTKEGTEGGEQEKVVADRAADDLIAAGWVPLEERFTPETGSVSADVIGAYADGRLADLRDGTRTLEVKLRLEDVPPDVGLGDDVKIVLGNPDLPAEGAPNLAWYAPGLWALVGSLGGMSEVAPGMWSDSAGMPRQIVADCRLLGWALSPEQGELIRCTPVMDVRGYSWQ